MKLEEELKQETFDNDFLKAILNVLVTADRISNVSNANLKPFGISKEQYNVLRILRGQYPNPTTLADVRDRMISKSSNATRLVEKLRSKGHVERFVCETNRRKVDILITKQGLDLLDVLDPIMRKHPGLNRNLNKIELKELNRLLDKMRG